MSDYYVSRIDEHTKVIQTQGKTYLVFEDEDWDGNAKTSQIEITNIGMAILALKDIADSKAREW
jgi:hypothetical protein